MPRKSKGVRLYWRDPQLNQDGTVRKQGAWIILDGSKQRGTGLGLDASEGQKAEALRAYLAERHAAGISTTNKKDPSQIPINDVLTKWVKDVVMKMDNPNGTLDRIAHLKKFWGAHNLDYVEGDTCDKYAESRTTLNVARRELEDLRSAINHHRKRGLHDRIISVALPDKPAAREQWLSIEQAAAAIRAAWRYREGSEDKFAGMNIIRARNKVWYYAWRNGPRIMSEWGTPEFECEFDEAIKNRPPRVRHDHKHVAKFMLFAFYMGSRSEVILTTSIEPVRPLHRPWVDLKNGIFHGAPIGYRETKKRRQRVEVDPKLLHQLRRWARKGQRYVVEFNGKPVGDIHKAHDAAIANAGLPDDVTPHTWRHTCATFLMQSGTDLDEIAEHMAMTVETLTRVYGHHRKGRLPGVRKAFARRRGQ